MGNIFSHLVRLSNGALPLNVGVSEVPAKYSQGLHIDSDGNIYASEDATVEYYNAGLPFTAEGRLVVTQTPPVRTDQGIPFGANGGVALGVFGPALLPDFIRQSGGVCTFPAAGTCKAQSEYLAESPSSGEGAPVAFILWTVDGGATIISGQGRIVVVVDGPDGDVDVSYNVTCRVENSQGATEITKNFTDVKTQV